MVRKAIIKKLRKDVDGIYSSYLQTNGSWSGRDHWILIYPMQFFGDTVQALEHLEKISEPGEVYVIEFAFVKE